MVNMAGQSPVIKYFNIIKRKSMKNNIKFKDLAQLYIERSKQIGAKNLESKEMHVRVHLIPHFDNEKVREINTFHIDHYKYQRKTRGAKDATINRELSTLSHIFISAVDWGIIKEIPCRIRRLREDNRRTTYLNPEQVQALLKAADEYPIKRIGLYIKIGLWTGMRMSEILSLRWEYIDYDKFVISLPKAKAGARLQPIPPALCEILRNHESEAHSPWLFPSVTGKDTYIKNIRKTFRNVVKLAGLDPKLVIRHTLRHTAITHLVQSGVSLPTVQKISGHKTLAMVSRYAHVSDRHVLSAFDKLGTSFSGAA